MHNHHNLPEQHGDLHQQYGISGKGHDGNGPAGQGTARRDHDLGYSLSRALFSQATGFPPCARVRSGKQSMCSVWPRGMIRNRSKIRSGVRGDGIGGMRRITYMCRVSGTINIAHASDIRRGGLGTRPCACVSVCVCVCACVYTYILLGRHLRVCCFLVLVSVTSTPY